MTRVAVTKRTGQKRPGQGVQEFHSVTDSTWSWTGTAEVEPKTPIATASSDGEVNTMSVRMTKVRSTDTEIQVCKVTNMRDETVGNNHKVRSDMT